MQAPAFFFQAMASRQASRLHAYRRYANAVKRHLIETHAAGARCLVDIGCGRGGDLGKWRHAGIRRVVATDLSEGRLDEARARRLAITAKLAFAGAFARHHNSMARQLRRGQLRTLHQNQRVGAETLGEMSRQEASARREAAELWAASRVEARRLSKARHQADVQAGLAERILIQQHEIEALRVRNEQLKKIRSFLAVPVEPPPIQPFEIGMTRDTGETYQSRYDDGVDLSQAGAKLGEQYTLVS
jgi:hypothetical protein